MWAIRILKRMSRGRISLPTGLLPLLLCSLMTPAFAQFTVVSIGHVSNNGSSRYANDVAVNGNYAYVSYEPTGVKIYDISNPTNPVSVGIVSSGVSPEGILLSGHTLYVPDYYSGLHVYDVSNPTNAVNIANTNNGGRPFNVALQSNHLFLVNGLSLRIYDVSDPTNIFSIGNIATGNNAQGVAVSGDYAYVANGIDGLRIYDISTPTNIVNVGHATDGNAHCVAVSGRYAYVLHYSSGLDIYDISDPSNPSRVGHSSGSASPYNFHGIVVAGNFAYACMRDGLRIFDVSDPANPVDAGSATFPSNVYGASGVTLSGDHICLANQGDGFRIYELAGPQLGVSLPTSNSIAVSWPTNHLSFVLQRKADLNIAAWLNVTNTPVVGSNQIRVLLPSPGGDALFRLKYP
jgi:hypothetical protein